MIGFARGIRGDDSFFLQELSVDRVDESDLLLSVVMFNKSIRTDGSVWLKYFSFLKLVSKKAVFVYFCVSESLGLFVR